MNLPDRIFALGGAGKAVTYELLEAEWVQESVLEPRPEPKKLTVTILDTAEEEKNRDLEKIQQLESKIRETKNELRDTQRGRPGDIDIEYLPLTENIQLHDQNDLIGEEIVPRIASGVGMDESKWWLQPEYINENLDFATGVVRKRGLGKGLYYKAYAEDDDIRTGIDLPGSGKVAVIAGLGGGTGSGILIDLVEDLRESHRSAEITLFGILPNGAEGEAENANAHAALSELEYLSLQNENIFKDRILIPIDPTDFGGKKANILQSSEALLEFDRAAVYLISSYYNMMDMEDPFAENPSYAPFIIGIPQVLRYNVDAIKDSKSAITDILTTKQEALEAESEIYAEIGRYLAKHTSSDESGGELHDTDRTDLEARLSNIKSLLDLNLFEELEYESVSIYREIIQEAEKESEDVPEQIEVIGSSIRAGSARVDEGGERFVDSIDKQLDDIAGEELNNLARRKEIIEQIRTIDTNRVVSTLSYLLNLGDEGANAGVRLKQLETKLEEIEDRHERLSAELTETEEELNQRHQEQRESVARKVDSWTQDVQKVHEELRECQSISIDSMVGSLERDVENFVQQVENADTVEQVETVADADVRQSLDTLSSDLNQIGIDITEEKRRINSSLADLTEAKKAFLKWTQEDGLLEKVSPFTTSAEEEKEEAEKNYQMHRTKLDDNGVFSLSRTGDELNLESNFNGDTIIRTLENETETRRRRIVDELRSRLEGDTDRAVSRLEDELERDATMDDLRETVQDIFESEMIETEDIEERRRELETELEDVQEELELYEGTVDLFQSLNNRCESFVSSQETYIEQRNSYGDTSGVTVDAGGEDYLYIKKIKPNDVLQLRDDTTIDESSLFEDQAERQRLRASLEELAGNAHNSKYNGIRKRRISNDRSRYSEMNVVVGVMSKAINQISEESDLQSVFQGAYNLGPGAQNYASYPVEAGGNWEVGLGIFIGGVFLDNIRAEVEPDGYQTGYQARKQSDDIDILIHHTYGLDEGYYVVRDKVLNLENPHDVDFFLRDESEIRDELLSDHISNTSTSAESSDESVDVSDAGSAEADR